MENRRGTWACLDYEKGSSPHILCHIANVDISPWLVKCNLLLLVMSSVSRAFLFIEISLRVLVSLQWHHLFVCVVWMYTFQVPNPT